MIKNKNTNKNNKNIADVVNQIRVEVNIDLDEKRKEKYFQDVVLLYSFIENILKWLIFNKILWDKSTRELDTQEVYSLSNFIKNSSFYLSLRIALSINLISFELYKKIEKVKSDRNNLVHQMWIYEHRNNFRIIRKKLEELADISSQLTIIINKLVKKIGISDVLNIDY